MVSNKMKTSIVWPNSYHASFPGHVLILMGILFSFILQGKASSLSAIVGQEVVLTCDIKVNGPDETYEWKRGTSINDSVRLAFTFGGQEPVCDKEKCTLRANGDLIFHEVTETDFEQKYFCVRGNEKYYAEHSLNLLEVPSCEVLRPQESAFIINPKKQEYKNGTSVTFSCLEGYYLDGISNSVCLLGQWNPSISATNCIASPVVVISPWKAVAIIGIILFVLLGIIIGVILGYFQCYKNKSQERNNTTNHDSQNLPKQTANCGSIFYALQQWVIRGRHPGTGDSQSDSGNPVRSDSQSGDDEIDTCELGKVTRNEEEKEEGNERSALNPGNSRGDNQMVQTKDSGSEVLQSDSGQPVRSESQSVTDGSPYKKKSGAYPTTIISGYYEIDSSDHVKPPRGTEIKQLHIHDDSEIKLDIFPVGPQSSLGGVVIGCHPGENLNVSANHHQMETPLPKLELDIPTYVASMCVTDETAVSMLIKCLKCGSCSCMLHIYRGK